MDGDVVIEVSFSDDAITGIAIVDDNETADVGDRALSMTADAIVANQTLAVDMVAGATVSSHAMIAAVTDAVQQAGGDAKALRSNAPNVIPQDIAYDYDVVVAGGGIAGLTAACKAAQSGARVALVEKLGIVGGTSIFSSGAFLASAEESGVEELIQAWIDRNVQEKNQVDADMVKALAAVSPEMIALLQSTGMESGMIPGGYFCPDPTEKAVKNASTIQLANAAVMQKAGNRLISTLEGIFTATGGDIYLNTPGTSLLTDEKGAVTGIVCETASGTRTFHAKAVILATGDYARNAEMTAEICPDAAGNYTATAVGNTGDGITMALQVGAVLDDYQHSMSGNFAPDPYDMPVVGQPRNSYPFDCLLVNVAGERVVSETAGTKVQMLHFNVKGEPDCGWVIMDEEIAANFLHLDEYLQKTANGSPHIQAYMEDSLEALAADMGVDTNTLCATVARYNELCNAQEDVDFGKDASYLKAIDDGVYYAVKEYNMTRGNYGGIVTNENAEVVDSDGNAIPGLYAAGIISSGAFFGDYYPGGEALGVGAHMGFIAGRNAAEKAK